MNWVKKRKPSRFSWEVAMKRRTTDPAYLLNDVQMPSFVNPGLWMAACAAWFAKLSLPRSLLLPGL